ncbi:helix-turn-helix transcriptional regulator [Phytohabitans houttuyneae]|uniref:ArsR family transcriptional regulator n=1 Tax=Phytohabitans houttuyneae TaxID=1076126 RepID=A0A6V8K856_9ACTN|nr:transcriptional regulator [Phytohabitans houttuyneae]GFJ77917.1 ArsR family transcriptional regulator [Phytohabitans houttuyneae]
MEDLEALALLTDPVRRSAYQVVAEAGAEPLGRDEVATALGVGRTLAAFHLDKLVDAGLLEVSFARRSGRSGPGAGRPAKLYRRAAGERAVSVPPRSYLSAAELLAEGIERAGADAAAYDVARRRGREAGAAAGVGADPVEVLAGRGYQPETDDSLVRLRNCPFHQLAQRFPPLVCGMNLALVEGVLEGAAAEGWSARLDPVPDHCCVSLSKNKSDDL